ncbi:hypothetical protein IMCC3317_12240 [Kordia antarctica]|uniref:Uncharacterized protein n=1 Tax=Kordia antarctica TaxID=1218801 RepID=A0A7L4ZI43_9FLAO|nr:hypothetical protein IMCC3317_12240 [Kordia antarctica]
MILTKIYYTMKKRNSNALKLNKYSVSNLKMTTITGGLESSSNNSLDNYTCAPSDSCDTYFCPTGGCTSNGRHCQQ